MIEFQQVTRRFAAQEVLREVSFRVNPGERIGIVGPNGAGKSTLFSLILGELESDLGSVITPKNLRFAHVRQQLFVSDCDDNLLDFTLDGLPEIQQIHAEIESIEHTLMELPSCERERALQRVGQLQDEYEHLGGYEHEVRAKAALGGLGFDEASHTRPLKDFSGGWQMRGELARALIARPDVLLLDEPSNYLDLPAVEWLRRYLRDFAGTLLLISHDRTLLRSLTDLTMEVAGGDVTRYTGGYDYFVRERDARRSQLLAAKANQDRQVEHLEKFVNRFRAQATKASQVQSRVKMLNKIERVEVADSVPRSSLIRLPAAPHSGHEVLSLENVGHGYGDDAEIFKGVNLRLERGERAALVGYNGMGKTTLLRIMAGVMEARHGKRTLGHQVVTGYQSQEFADTMSATQSAFEIVRKAGPNATDQEIRSVLGGFGFTGDAIHKPCRVLSGGEKIRLAFARIFIDPPNLLLLDEPTTHLDLMGCETLEKALCKYEGALCVVSHDITFVRNLATTTYAVTPRGVQRYQGGYDYFLEKTGGFSGEAPPPMQTSGPDTPTAPTAAPAPPPKQGKERRELQRELRNEERKAGKVEGHILRLEKEQAELLEKLQSGAAADFASYNKQLTRLQSSLDLAQSDWEAAVQRMDDLQTELK